tara:strand:- start:7978 stop:8232 length:255 start_codon:yes stop_codon:yes gene_type:complete
VFSRRKPERSESGEEPCLFCARVRIFLLIVCVLLVLIAFRIELLFLRNISLTAVAADLIGLSVIAILLWKGYHEYWKSDDKKDR